VKPLITIQYLHSYSDLKAKAKRWDEKQVDGLKKKRDQFLNELKDLAKHRRKEPELQNLQSQIDGLDNRLRFCRKDRDNIVCSSDIEPSYY
jgi:structural maintenance of chromosome 1